MTERTHWMNDVTSIRQIRDELRLKAGLLRADLRDQLERLEHDFAKLERDGAHVCSAPGSGHSICLAVSTVFISQKKTS